MKSEAKKPQGGRESTDPSRKLYKYWLSIAADVVPPGKTMSGDRVRDIMMDQAEQVIPDWFKLSRDERYAIIDAAFPAQVYESKTSRRDMVSFLREVDGWDSWEDAEPLGREGTVPDDDDAPIVVVEPEPPDTVRTTPMMKQQPTELEQLPVHDEDFVPTNAQELSRGLKLLFSEVPDEAAAWMWKRARKLRAKIDQAVDDREVTAEGRVRSIVRRAIAEAGLGKKRDPWAREAEGGIYGDGPTPEELAAIEVGDDDWESKWEKQWGDTSKAPTAVMALSDEDADMLASLAKQADPDELDPADRAAEEEAAEEEERKRPKRKYVTTGEEGMTLKDIASKLGYSGASGVRNLIYRLTDKMQYFASLDEVWFNELMETFARAYVEELRDAVGENLDPTEAAFLDELMDDPETVMRLPEFRMWSADYLKTIYKGNLGKRDRQGG